IGQAMHYFLNHVRQLAHYTMDGKYCIDNNLIENSARPIAVGRLCSVQHNLPYVGIIFMLA
ncbi:IS66 family transposase, partial [Bacteroides caecigallinarum]|uniref:IS66 family transposase n=1 Tax=Bacteroides caecigallinarum TaxID=1411144 RepID=UPI001F304C2F